LVILCSERREQARGASITEVRATRHRPSIAR
jgi:hypothetical protein